MRPWRPCRFNNRCFVSLQHGNSSLLHILLLTCHIWASVRLVKRFRSRKRCICFLRKCARYLFFFLQLCFVNKSSVQCGCDSCVLHTNHENKRTFKRKKKKNFIHLHTVNSCTITRCTHLQAVYTRLCVAPTIKIFFLNIIFF